MEAPAYHCPACGGPSTQVRRGHCEFCGAVRVPLGSPDPRRSKPCSGCIAPIAEDCDFCPRCGAAQGETPAPVSGGGIE